MIRPPLFGKDSSPQYTAPRLSAVCTAVLSFLFLLLMFILPGPKNKKINSPVRIILDPLPVEKKELISSPEPPAGLPEIQEAEPIVSEPVTPVIPEESPVPKTEPQKKVIEEPKPVSKTETPKPSAVQKTEPQPVPENKKVQPFVPKKSVEELMAEAEAARYEKAGETAIDPFLSFDQKNSGGNDSEQVYSQDKIENPFSSETAATSSERTTSSLSSKTEQTNQKEYDYSTSQQVLDSVNNLRKTNYVKKSSGSETSASLKTDSQKTNGISVGMDNGSSRVLLYPAEPSIGISDMASKTITEDITVRISFTVLSDGNVVQSGIFISPSLNQLITDEIISQLSKWKFEAGSGKSTCSFDFSIKIRR